ncbi:glycosyltransferase family 4 protein [Rhodoferax sp. GW822-FHT02A01]|uniref:glycosyltransferase family 4 protein n=1 Tax=Rhodoferax sp. GW822-FHT02A01 TaxID=3141537 RepID=UPI00315D30E6
MKILFVHQNFPGQYLHLARHLGASGQHQVVFITQRKDALLPGVKNIVYKPQRAVTKGVHHYLRDTEAGVLNAQNVARVALDLKQSGFVPDVMLGHNGWGELWYLKDVFPDTPLIGYFEFFYRLHGADVGFEPGSVQIFDTGPRIRTKNLGNLLALDAVDLGQCPTQWQKSLYPTVYQPKLHVVHEGIDTQLVTPDLQARLKIPGGEVELAAGDEVITYVARNLEPYRGFPNFMRSLPAILASRPNAQALIVGGDATSYGPPLAHGKSFREQMLAELGSALDLKRVHFLGKVPYSMYLKVLQVSRVHIYLTYPFVLSWSMLEAMAAGCVVVGSNTAPVQEVIRDGVNGFLVDMFSPDTIAKRTIEVLQDPRAYDAMRVAARQSIVRGYDLANICLPAQLKMLHGALHNRV